MLARTKCVLFDVTGTLIYMKEASANVYIRIGKQHGVIRIGDDENAELMHERFKKAFGSASPMTGPVGQPEKQWWFDQIIRKVIPSNCPDTFCEELYNYYARANPAWALYEDTIPTLERLYKLGIKMGVVTNFDSRVVTILKDLKIAKYFDAITHSTEAGVAKPNGKIFNIALLRINDSLKKEGIKAAIHKQEVLVIGDSDKDIAAAKAAGIDKVFTVRRSSSPPIGLSDILKEHANM